MASTLSEPVNLAMPVSPLISSPSDLSVTSRIITLQPGAYNDPDHVHPLQHYVCTRVYSFRSVILGSQNVIYGPASGRVIIYITDTWDSQGGTIVNPQNLPASFQINGTATCTLVKLTGGNSSYYCVDAPSANVMISGGSDVFGAFNAKNVSISGGGSIHYDTSLRDMGARTAIVTLKYWKRY